MVTDISSKPVAYAPRVIVVMAVFEPDAAYLDQQIASLEAQTHDNIFLLLVNADTASAEVIEQRMEKSRLPHHVAVPASRLDSYRAFEFGLNEALALSNDDDVFALCDQDDVWHPQRISETLVKLSNVDLVHSDARIVGPNGDLLHASLFRAERRAYRPGLRGLLLRNNVTGMTSLMTRSLVQAALPFPSQGAVFFHHDLWLALVASALRGIEFVSRALVDYRQHGGNSVGALPNRDVWLRPGSAAWRRHRAGDYFVAAYLAKCLYLRMTEIAEGNANTVDKDTLQSLAPYLAIRGLGAGFVVDAIRWGVRGRFRLANRSLAFAALRLARLGWALERSVSAGLVPELAEFDRKGFSLAPGAQPAAIQGQSPGEATLPVADIRTFSDPRMSPKFRVRIDVRRRGGMVVLLPTLNPTEIFAGIATAIDIGVGLAARGVSVTFVACDLPVASIAASRAFVLRRGQKNIAANCEELDIRLVCGVTTPTISFASGDRFLATAWWTAHVARELTSSGAFANRRFHYLIQDFEPNFYAWSDESAAALASYSFDHEPIFNTTLLREYFTAQGIGAGNADALTFHPSIDVVMYGALRRTNSDVRRLAVYGRPMVARNLFPTALQAVDRFLDKERLGPCDIELVSVGLPHADVRMSQGSVLRSFGKIPWSDYPDFLAGIDVGLSLMLSPHPSHLPIEMAAAGARVVTNGFAGKDLSTLSPAILSAAPEPEAIAASLSASWHAPPVSTNERMLDLSVLGDPLDSVVDALAAMEQHVRFVA